MPQHTLSTHVRLPTQGSLPVESHGAPATPPATQAPDTQNRPPVHCALVVHVIRHAVVVEQVREFGQGAGVTLEHVPAAVPAAVPWHTLFGVKTFVDVLHAASPQDGLVQHTLFTHVRPPAQGSLPVSSHGAPATPPATQAPDTQNRPPVHCALVVHVIRHAVVVEQVREFGQGAGVTLEHVPAAVPAAVPWHTLFGVKTFVDVSHVAFPQDGLVQHTLSTHVRPPAQGRLPVESHGAPATPPATQAPDTHNRPPVHCALVVHVIRHAVVVEQVREFGQGAGVTLEHVPAAVPAAVPLAHAIRSKDIRRRAARGIPAGRARATRCQHR